MPLNTQFLFPKSDEQIASLICEKAKAAKSIQIVTGYATLDGIKKIANHIKNKLSLFIIGRSTYEGCEALRYLIKLGVPNDNLKINLGLKHEANPTQNRNFTPMMHSKIIYIVYDNGFASAFIGSHNVTSYSLCGKNFEAGVLVEGNDDDVFFQNVRRQIEAINKVSSRYEENKKHFYEAYAKSLMNGFTNSMFKPDDTRTVLIFAKNEFAELEFEKRISIELNKLIFDKPQGTKVHIYLFKNMFTTAQEAFHKRDSAVLKYRGVVEESITNYSHGQIEAEYVIEDNNIPVIKKSNIAKFKGELSSENYNCIIRIKAKLLDEYEYILNKKNEKYSLLTRSNRSDQWLTVVDIGTPEEINKLKNSQESLFSQDDVAKESSEQTQYHYIMISHYDKLLTKRVSVDSQTDNFLEFGQPE
jgi:hypothetical protein